MLSRPTVLYVLSDHINTVLTHFRKWANMRTAAQVSRIVSLQRPTPFDTIAKPAVVRFSLKDLEKDYAKTEDDIKAVQSVGQIIGEVMKQLDDERCEL